MERASFNLWPVHLKPLTSELLSSWLARLSLAHGLKVFSFTNIIWPGKRLGDHGRDVDERADNQVIEVLSEKTNTPVEKAFATTLTSYQGKLYEYIPSLGPVKWIMPISVYRAKHKRFGMQFCPFCLIEDKTPYFRKNWRIAYTVLCIKHKIRLLDRCSRCEEPINYYWHLSDKIDEQVPVNLTTCQSCKLDLRNSGSHLEMISVRQSEVSFQQHLEETLERGWTEVCNGVQVYSLLYFEVLYILMSLLSSCSAAKIREAITKHYSLDGLIPSYAKKGLPVELLGVIERRGLTILAGNLLSDWPDGFVSFCKENRLWMKTLCRKQESVPFWYWSVINEHLNRCKYNSSDEEFASLLAYLRRINQPVTGTVLSKYLSPRVYLRRAKLEGLNLKPRNEGRECPYCHNNEQQVKASSPNKRPAGNFRFFCRICRRSYTPNPIHYGIPPHVRNEAIRLRATGLSYRCIAGTLGICINSVRKFINSNQP